MFTEKLPFVRNRRGKRGKRPFVEFSISSVGVDGSAEGEEETHGGGRGGSSGGSGSNKTFGRKIAKGHAALTKRQKKANKNKNNKNSAAKREGSVVRTRGRRRK